MTWRNNPDPRSSRKSFESADPVTPRNHDHADVEADQWTRGFSDHSNGASPDFTRSIMGRLGYMHVAPAVSRKRAWRRWIHRASLAATAAIMVGLGVRMYENSSMARRPLGPTIPAAIGNDLHQHGNRIDRAIQTIRNLAPKIEIPVHRAPPAVEPDGPTPAEPEPDDWSSAPMRWV